MLGVRLTSLDRVLSGNDVVVCLVPLTPATDGSLARARPAAVGLRVRQRVTRPVVDSAALIERLKRGDIESTGLDIFDCRSRPRGQPIRQASQRLQSHRIIAGSGAVLAAPGLLIIDELERFFAGDRVLRSLRARSPTGGGSAGTPADLDSAYGPSSAYWRRRR